MYAIQHGNNIGFTREPIEGSIEISEAAWQEALQNKYNTIAEDGSMSYVDYRTLEELQNAKVAEINVACRSVIVGGFDSDALGSTHRYHSKEEDQVNLVGAAQSAIELPYRCAPVDDDGIIGEYGYVLHTAAQISKVFLDGVATKSEHLQRAALLKAQVADATTPEELEVIVW